MSTIVFFCIPAQGHVNPTLGVVRELTARGHQVIYYCYEPLRQRIEAAGAEFVSCDKYDAEMRLSSEQARRVGSDLALSTRVLVDTTLTLDETVCAHMAKLKPDCIVADSMAVWGKAAAMKLGIPFVSSTTTFAFNKHSAKIMKQSHGKLFSMLFALPSINKDIKRLQKAGYQVKNVLDLIANDENTHTVVYTSPEFQPAGETFTDKYAFVGPLIRPATENVEKKREKLLYISMGTVNNAMLPLYKSCVEAFADSPYQVIMSVGQTVDMGAFAALPENISVYGSVDQIAVLNKADAFISHCGMNSASEAMYCGVPLVLLPQTDEQGGVAARVEQLGAGIRPKNESSAALRAAVDKVMSEPRFKENALKISAGFRRCGGAKAAADKILSVCK